MDDPELHTLIQAETDFYLNAIDLIAASNAPLRSVRANEEWGVAQFRSAEGLIGERPYAGQQHFDALEALAAQRGCAAYHAEHCNVQPLSGSMANLAVYKALLKPGDTILSMATACGGHLSHGHSRHFVRDLYRVAHYEVDRETSLLDYDRIRTVALQVRPRLIVGGYSSYPRAVDFRRLKDIGDEVGADVMADISHISGLVAAGLHQNPCESRLIVTSAYEKTLRGTRGGFILCPLTHARRIDQGVFPGLQSSVGLSNIVSAARAFLKAQTPEFAEYQKRVISNARHLARTLSQAGLSVVTGGTDTHMVIMNVKACGLTGEEAERRLEEIGILSNRNLIPFDPLPPFQASGLRLGSAQITARGFRAEDVQILGECIADALLAPQFAGSERDRLRGLVRELAACRREGDTLQDLLGTLA